MAGSSCHVMGSSTQSILNSLDTMAGRKETLDIHRIIVVGMSGIGKSALILQYMYDEVSEGALSLVRLAANFGRYCATVDLYILCSL